MKGFHIPLPNYLLMLIRNDLFIYVTTIIIQLDKDLRKIKKCNYWYV